MKDELLPIGTIVEVENLDLMICAYFKKGAKIGDNEFDYACCVYPMGMGKDAVLIKKEQIKRIKFVGFQDYKFNNLKETMEKENEK